MYPVLYYAIKQINLLYQWEMRKMSEALKSLINDLQTKLNVKLKLKMIDE